MATLTYDPTPADQPEFNEQEQEALAIGEQAAAEQQQMLAGKFKDAEALEQAYIELQKKLGESNEDGPDKGREQEELPSEEEVEEPSETTAILTDASAEYAENGSLSDETLQKLTSMDSKDLITAYMELQTQPQNRDLSPEAVSSIYKSIGGEDNYNALTSWAGENLPEGAVSAYNNVVNSGDPNTIQLALAGLKAAYDEANGVDGTMLTGKPAQDRQEVFRSQAEVVQAMSDPRYDRDPAYRQDVFNKLNRSNIQY